MYCEKCGAKLPDNTNFCNFCGVRLKPEQETQEAAALTVGAPALNISKGFSEKINDPAFAKYLKNSNRWALIFSVGLALIAVLGFTIAGAMGVDNMENPQAFFYGLGVGGMFILIGLFSVLSRKRSRTWDGTVVDKKVQKKRRQEHYTDDDYRWVEYLEYSVVIKEDNGKKHEIKANDDDTKYNYFSIGDRVRHHGGLNSYEKYDKTGDTIIFCNACATLCDINDDTCFRCKCPLLK